MSVSKTDLTPLRSLLFAPANDLRKARRMATLEMDAGVLDLEDAVAESAKWESRRVLAELLPGLCEAAPMMVRVNGLATGLAEADLAAAVCPGLRAVVVPKVESATEVNAVDEQLGELERERGIAAASVRILPLVETARGILAAAAIGAASSRVLTLVLGSGDLTTQLQLQPLADGAELAFARAQVVLAAAANGLAPPIDGPYLEFRDEQGLRVDSRRSRGFGFGGRVVVHPDQVAAVNSTYERFSSFTPDLASRIVAEFEEAGRRGVAAIDVDGTFVDYPIYARARAVAEGTQVPGEAPVR